MKIQQKDIFGRLMKQLVFIVALYLVLSVLVAVGVLDRYRAYELSIASIYVIVALGLNLVTGMTGQLVLGHAGFMAIGGYSTALLMLRLNVPMVPALIAGGLISATFGMLIGIPALRLKGDYLAIVTLGFGEIIRVVLTNLDKLTGGAAGLMAIPGFPDINGQNSLSTFVIVSLVMVLSIIAVVHLMTSSHGRAILSVRDDEIASESMGINVFYTKLYAFVFSTFLAGIAGGLFAMQNQYLNPAMFDFLKSMDFLIIVVFGGMGSITGTVAASFVLTIAQEELRFLQDYRLVIYPLLLILMMIFRPQGLLGTKEIELTRVLSKAWWADKIEKIKQGGKKNART